MQRFMLLIFSLYFSFFVVGQVALLQGEQRTELYCLLQEVEHTKAAICEVVYDRIAGLITWHADTRFMHRMCANKASP